MIENINDLLSLLILSGIILSFIFQALKYVFSLLEKKKLKKELDYIRRRRGD